ncbi:MAG: hypothetical protein WD096_02625 [Actinomycetota bacterium]
MKRVGLEPRDQLPISIRVFTDREPDQEPGRTRRPRLKRSIPREALVFDTETYPGPTQQLMVLAWRLYRDDAGAIPGTTCIEEGFAYPDALAEKDPDGFARLVRFVAEHEERAERLPGFPGLRLMPVSGWLQERFFIYAYKHRDRCDIVVFNGMFDLGRIAAHWAPARGRYRGGWSLGFWGSKDLEGTWHDARFHPRLLALPIDPLRTLYSWGSLAPKDVERADATARIVDLHTVVSALTDRNLSLESACRLFGEDWTKADVTYGEISPELLSYALEDVRYTAGLYRAVHREVAKHTGILIELHRCYSPATIGARYLRAMGLLPPLVKFGGRRAV